MTATPAHAAMFLLPFVVPICIYVAWSDMATMKIPNIAVIALAITFVIVGFFAFPFDAYLWRLSHLVVVLAIGIMANAAGFVGAGDAKFAAAAAPFVALADLRFLILLFSACLLAGFLGHRLAKFSPLRAIVPEWQSWKEKKHFPMGLPLAGTLLAYLGASLA
ncbi:MAG: prepilin peptidase [Rhodobacteraceae bacterium]|nr:prepilin peptidase [Paracoccaceae bacterium]